LLKALETLLVAIDREGLRQSWRDGVEHLLSSILVHFARLSLAGRRRRLIFKRDVFLCTAGLLLLLCLFFLAQFALPLIF
jgi:hypothetical protein